MADSPVPDHKRSTGSHRASAGRDTPEDPTYALGRSKTETRRLILQSDLYGDVMQRFLRDAGVCQGMTVLDVGSGAGDVAFTAGYPGAKTPWPIP